MLGWLLDILTASPWAYGALFLLVLLDVLFPPAPGEIALVTSGVLAGGGELSIALVLLAATGGAVAGDQLVYGMGRSLRGYGRGRLFHRARGRLPEAEEQLAARGASAIILGRFIPFGRTALTLASGILRFPWLRFAALDAFAALLWATQGALIGYFGGKAFQSPLVGVALGLLLALAITAALEASRRRRQRRPRPDRQAVPPSAAPACTSPDS
jgi:membrane protein DedA with SNARE-associated domain